MHSTYYLTATSNAACLSTGSVVVNIKSITVTPTSNSPVCEGDILRLYSSSINNATYAWTGPDNFKSSQQNPVLENISTASKGLYTVIASDNNGCSNTANVTVNVSSKPNVTINPVLTNVCYGNSVTLTASGASSYQWSPSEGLSSTTGSSVIANPALNSTYTVIGKDANGCTNSGYTIINKDTIHVHLGENDSICAGSSVTLDAGISPATYTWNDNSHNKTLTVTQQGSYSVTVIDNYNCASSDEIEVIAYTPIPLNMGKDRTIDVDTTIILHAGTGFKIYKWQDGTTDSTYSVTKMGKYWVLVTDKNGCKLSDTVDVKVACYSKGIFIPNVFTPGNSKSICDSYFRVEGRCLGKAELTIFNRWGEKIYSNSYDFSASMDSKVCNDTKHIDIVGKYNNIYYYLLWDGTDKKNGGSVAEGTYFYIFTYSISDDNLTNTLTKKGSVTIIK